VVTSTMKLIEIITELKSSQHDVDTLMQSIFQ